MKAVIRHLRAAALCCKGEGPSDGLLLELFILRREESAFEALVRRHGPMVFGVCRRILRNVHDAEDAFQATFLVLSRKAAAVKPRDMVGNWLYGVAYRTAMKARAMDAKRRMKEKQADAPPNAAPSVAEELLEHLDHELNRLPEKYRVPIVLCELEGRSRREAARSLGLPEGTLSWRLAQAKKMLAQRLVRRGVALSIGALATVMAEGFSPTLRASTLKTVFSAGSVPANVLTLTEGVMKAMLLSKLKITVCAAALMLTAGFGATGLTYRATAQQPRQEFDRASRPQADELEALRLEFEAMRKSLQATRARVKALEEEVRVLQSGNRRPGGIRQGDIRPGTHGGYPAAGVSPMPIPASRAADIAPSTYAPPAAPIAYPGAETQSQARPSAGTSAAPRLAGPTSALPAIASTPQANSRQSTSTANPYSKPTTTTTDPLAHAERALKKLRANPGDKQAVEALERALKRLKEREKPDQPGEDNYKP